jgi:hypothetical protein
VKTRTYDKTKPYGKLTILKTAKRYFLLAPVALDYDEVTGLQSWSVVSCYDGMPDMLDYSTELNAILHDEILTLIVHPTNIAIELSDQHKEIYYWSGYYEEEPEEETDIDLSEDDNYYLMPDYLLDIAPVEYEQPVMYDDGFPV